MNILKTKAKGKETIKFAMTRNEKSQTIATNINIYHKHILTSHQHTRI
jgi:hypothetical protein